MVPSIEEGIHKTFHIPSTSASFEILGCGEYDWIGTRATQDLRLRDLQMFLDTINPQ